MSGRADETYHIPPDWGADPLGNFVEDARRNCITTFTNLRRQYDALAEIDRICRVMIDNLNQSPELVCGFLLIRTHSSFLGAARLCLSGQLAEAYMVLRGCLENALYGLYVAGNTSRQEIWLRRHEDEASRRRMQKEFTIRNVMNHLQSVDPTSQHVAQTLYDRTIDYGAHPNERSVTTQVKTQRDGSRVNFTANYLICGDLAHEFCLRSAAQVGICCLDVFQDVWRDRYRILGLDVRLDQLRQGF